jgi:hypothetical protein
MSCYENDDRGRLDTVLVREPQFQSSQKCQKDSDNTDCLDDG